MKCMCAQTRPRFILSSEGVLGGMEFQPILTPREKSPLPENVPRGGSNPRHCGQRAQALPTELFRPPLCDVIRIAVVVLGVSHLVLAVCGNKASLACWLGRSPSEWQIWGLNPAWARSFPGSGHTSDLNICTPVASLAL